MSSVDVDFEGEVEGRFRAKQWTDWEKYINDPFYRGSGVQLLKAVGLARREQLDVQQSLDDEGKGTPEPQTNPSENIPGSTRRWYKGIVPDDLTAGIDPVSRDQEANRFNDIPAIPRKAAKRSGSLLTEPEFSRTPRRFLPAESLTFNFTQASRDNTKRRTTLPYISTIKHGTNDSENNVLATENKHSNIKHMLLARKSSYAILPSITAPTEEQTRRKRKDGKLYKRRASRVLPDIDHAVEALPNQPSLNYNLRYTHDHSDKSWLESTSVGLKSIKETSERNEDEDTQSGRISPFSEDEGFHSLTATSASATSEDSSTAKDGLRLPPLMTVGVHNAPLREKEWKADSKKRSSLLSTNIGRRTSLKVTSESSFDDYAKAVYLTELKKRLVSINICVPYWEYAIVNRK